MAGYEMTRHSAFPLLAGIVAFATAATLAADATAQAPGDPGVSVRADLGPPASPRGRPPDGDPAASGNPLWAIPLKLLNNTRDRPIFSPSRRPPPAVAVDRPYVPPPVARVQPPPPPEPLTLSLLGTIAGESEGIALFMERNTQMVVRLRTGEAHEGWVLRSVHGREALLEKGDRKETVTLPDPGVEASSAEMPRAAPPPPPDAGRRPARR
jgi:hypothetical protein